MFDVVRGEDGKYYVRNNLTGFILADRDSGEYLSFDLVSEAIAYGETVWAELSQTIEDITSRQI